MSTEAAAQPRRAGLPLGRPLGIPVYLAPSWVIVSVFIAVSAAGEFAGDGRGATSMTVGEWAVGVVVAASLAASVLAHELGHSIVSLLLGIPIRRITLFLFGGYAEIARESRNPTEEYAIAVAGPLVSLFLGGVFGAIWLATPRGGALQFVFGYLASTNAVLAVLNLLPGLPLDGGRVLRAVMWQRSGDRARATRTAVRGGQVLALLLAAIGVVAVFGGEPTGAFTLLLAAFLWANATAAGRQTEVATRVPHLHVRLLARPAIPVPAALPLSEALRHGGAARSWLFVVDSYGRPAGVVSAAAVDAVPPARRPWVSVGEVCRTIVPGLVLPADLTGQAIIEAMRATPASEYLVVEPDGAVVGVLAAHDVARHVDPRVPAGAPA